MKKVSYDYENRYTTTIDGEKQEVVLPTRVEHFVADSEFEDKMALYKKEAVGEITVEDIPDEDTPPSQLDQIEAQVTYTAMMTDTLLEV